MDTVERVRALVVPVLEGADLELYDLELSGGSLRVLVDRPGGVDIDAIGRASRAISNLLDEEDPISGPFTLEVSSPGLERPLRTAAHFAAAVGEVVNLKLKPGAGAERRLKGTVSAVDGDTITVVAAGAEADPHRIALADISRARTVFEWGPAPKPGRPATPSAQQKAAKP